MQTSFLIKILAWELRVVFEQLTVVIRVFVRQVGAERVRVLRAPDWGVTGIYNQSRGIEMIGMDVIHLDWPCCDGFADYGDRNIFQPDGFLPHQPIISWCGCAGIVPVFANQLPRRAIEEEKLGAQRAIFADALIQGIVFIVVSFCIFDRHREFSSGIPGKRGGAVVQWVTGGIIVVDLCDRACHIE